jgi:hypothetical protein
MNPVKARTTLALLALCASLTAAGEEPGIHFQRRAWEIACDNTLTCRMAGFCNEANNGDNTCGSVLITRAAGPDAPLEGKLTLTNWSENDTYEPPRVLPLWINDGSQGDLYLREKDHAYPLTPTQIRALLAAAINDKSIEFRGTSKSFTLSGKGISAVLLKMDEFQGRIGTPGALIRTGRKPEERVLSPRPVPVIRAAKVSAAPSRVLAASEVAALKPLLTQSMGKEGCMFENQYGRFGEVLEHADFILTPLDERHVLISTLCWQGAYNDGYAHWVMDSALSGMPKFVTGDAYDENSDRKDGYLVGKIINRHRRYNKGVFLAGWIGSGTDMNFAKAPNGIPRRAAASARAACPRCPRS